MIGIPITGVKFVPVEEVTDLHSERRAKHALYVKILREFVASGVRFARVELEGLPAGGATNGQLINLMNCLRRNAESHSLPVLVIKSGPNMFFARSDMPLYEKQWRPDPPLTPQSPIHEADFSVRTYHLLEKAGVKALSDLTNLKQTELQSVRGFGTNCLAEVMGAMRRAGVHFQPEDA